MAFSVITLFWHCENRPGIKATLAEDYLVQGLPCLKEPCPKATFLEAYLVRRYLVRGLPCPRTTLSEGKFVQGLRWLKESCPMATLSKGYLVRWNLVRRLPRGLPCPKSSLKATLFEAYLVRRLPCPNATLQANSTCSSVSLRVGCTRHHGASPVCPGRQLTAAGHHNWHTTKKRIARSWCGRFAWPLAKWHPR